MIEIFRKGFRLDIPRSQVVTFKKAVNLNGIQNSYSYSNTFPIELTANNRKLLGLPDLPSGKLGTLQNGYAMDVVLNGSIQLRNQTVKVTKESKTKADIYILFADSSIVSKLKKTMINDVVKERQYRKTYSEFVGRSINISVQNNPNYAVAYVETQSLAGQYVVEEMPELVNLQFLITKMLADIGYTLYGDFVQIGTPIREYYIAPNAGLYQINNGGGTVPGFAPNFDKNLTAFDLLSQTLTYFNCYASIDDTYKSVVINRWTNLGQYKNGFKDYSKYFVDYQDFTFQSRLAKINDLTYSESESTFNSFFTNSLSSQERATYLASKFGSGGTQLFDDSDVEEDGTIPLRLNNEEGETSAIRIYKLGTFRLGPLNPFIYEKGVRKNPASAFKANSVPMRVVYEDFHRAYTDFILTPLIQNLEFKYDAILAAEFSLTQVFFIEQQAAYWIPLEISFSTKADKINVRAMLIKGRKVISPTLNNFNAVLLDFKQKVIFTKSMLLSMYPAPVPNEYPWDVVIFKSYDQTKNRLFINDILVPANSLPQAFSINSLLENSITILANEDSDTLPDTDTDSLFIQALDTNGGLSNEAYITLKHTGTAKLESNFLQVVQYERVKTGYSQERISVSPFEYIVGPRPNLNDTLTSAELVEHIGNAAPPATFNLIDATQVYQQLRLEVPAFQIVFETVASNAPLSVPKTEFWMYASFGANLITISSGTFTGANGGPVTLNVAKKVRLLNNVMTGQKIKVYFRLDFTSAPIALGTRTSKVRLLNVAANFITLITT